MHTKEILDSIYRSTYAAAEWYFHHLATQKPIIMVTLNKLVNVYMYLVSFCLICSQFYNEKCCIKEQFFGFKKSA